MMAQVDEMRDYLRKFRAGEFPHRTGVSHMMELLALMKSGLGEFGETQETHYSPNGLVSEILFADGLTYVIEIKEKK
jgi:hypothetical protein